MLWPWSACTELRSGPFPGVGGASGGQPGGAAPIAGKEAPGGAAGEPGAAGSGGTPDSGGGESVGGGGQAGESGAAGSGASGGTPLPEAGAPGTAGEGGAGGSPNPRPPCDLSNTPLGESCALDAPSCRGLTTRCGDDQESCCTSTYLPGDEYLRSYDTSQSVLQNGLPVSGIQASASVAAKVDAFWLDRYEVTVGRFRQFLSGYTAWRMNKPFTNDGMVLDLNGSGWNAVTMNPSLPADEASARLDLLDEDCGSNVSWTDSVGDNEALPITCVTWFLAYAFCIWDGGRLPTEAEWNYAAAAGPQQRAFPWSSPASDARTPAPSQANLQSSGLVPVGTSSAPGFWGHHDLSGNAFEWTRDTCSDCNIPESATPGADIDSYRTTTCNHCVELGGPKRIIRGGSWKFHYVTGRTAYRAGNPPANSYDDIGFRCARNPL